MSNKFAKIQAIWHHPMVVIGSNLFLLMLLYVVSSLFFYWVNSSLFPNMTAENLRNIMWGSLRFDLTTVLYLSSLYLLLMLLPLPWSWRTNKQYQCAAKWCLWVPNIIGLFANTVDCVYAPIAGRRMSIGFFTEFANDGNLGKVLAENIISYWYVALFFIALVAVLVLFTRSVQISKPLCANRWGYYTTETLFLLLCSYATVIGIRGGPGAYTYPINTSIALQYVKEPQETMIVLNTPFTMIRSKSERIYHAVHYFTDEEVEQIMSPEHTAAATKDQPLKNNVIIIVLESFSKEYVGFFNHHWHNGTYQGYSPFLDSLLAQSITYTHSFASGVKSIDALPSVVSSIPMLQASFITTPYVTNRISSVADCLKEQGYQTAFFHGAPNGSMGFEAFMANAGFARYYGETEYKQAGYPNAFDGTWAIWDEEFLDYTVHTIDTMAEPFCTTIFTASSHNPFHLPERYQGAFAQGSHPIHPCIGYADHALREFFLFAQRQPWFERTLFVITADHTNTAVEPEASTSLGRFAIPICFYQPGVLAPRVDSTTVISQTDIMPSLLAYMGYQNAYFAFGENALLAKKKHNYAICYNAPAYQIMSDSLLLQFDGEKVISVYDYAADPLLKHTIDTTQNKYKYRVEDMTSYLKAYIQQYKNRMITNRLTYGTNR